MGVVYFFHNNKLKNLLPKVYSSISCVVSFICLTIVMIGVCFFNLFYNS